ncbi:MAG: hypothetical protein LBT86_06450 [Deltaproteobacteria bacterium]|jgi:hypothetical protein|nr:hypothetical protein [Deltaproteobacteria bacterium]
MTVTWRLVTLVVCLAFAPLMGCISSSRLRVVYDINPGPPLKPGTVQLLVQDRRTGSLIGPEAKAKDIFQASQGGQMDLTTKNPDGSQIDLSDLSTSKLVWEAVRRNLGLIGINAITGAEGAKARVLVTIDTLSVDIEGREAKAQVSLSVDIDRPGLPNSYQTRGFGQSSRANLFGDQGGSKALSEALTIAINNFNFSGLNNFQ